MLLRGNLLPTSCTGQSPDSITFVRVSCQVVAHNTLLRALARQRRWAAALDAAMAVPDQDSLEFDCPGHRVHVGPFVGRRLSATCVGLSY